MKKIMPYVAGVFFSIFGVGVIILLMSYTFEALAYVFPDNFTAQVMGMILFDFAALAWVGAFIYLCRSIMQYVFALLGFVFGLLGSLAMVAVDVILGGQKMIEPPVWVNSLLIYGFIVAAAIHVILFYLYKLTAPEISADIALGIETAQITEEAMKQAEGVLLAQRNALGGVIAPRLVNNVRRNLGLPVSSDVLDLPALDVTPKPAHVQAYAQRPISFWERLRAAGQGFINPAPVVNVRSETSTPAPIQQDAKPNETQTNPVDEKTPDAESKSESEAAEVQPAPLSPSPNGHK
jgi:hypothetical protein